MTVHARPRNIIFLPRRRNSFGRGSWLLNWRLYVLMAITSTKCGKRLGRDGVAAAAGGCVRQKCAAGNGALRRLKISASSMARPSAHARTLLREAKSPVISHRRPAYGW